MAIIRAARGRMGGADTGAEDQLDTLRNRIRELEQRLLDDEKKIAERPSGNGWGAGPDPGQASGAGRQEAAAVGQPAQAKPAVKKQYPKAVPEDVADIVRNWTKYISQLPPGMTRVSLLGAKHSVGDHGQLVIVFSNYVTADHFIHDEGYRNRLRYFLRQCSGKDVEIEYKHGQLR